MANRISIEIVPYAGWRNCVRLTNGIVDLIATTDVGPRIIRYGFVGQPNEFKEYPQMLGKVGGRQWCIYGGHRLWYAPEHKTRTYYPDNFLVEADWRGDTLRLTQATETTTRIQKELIITLSRNSTRVTVKHRIRNTGRKAQPLAPWALSVMAKGGTAILPLPPRGSHPKDLLPANTLTLWKYTEMSDARWKWGNKFILLRQDGKRRLPQKIGASVPDGWLGYARDGHLFIKTFPFVKSAVYPDLGCNAEIFTNHEMLEVESLGALVNLKSRQSVEHIETWSLFQGVPMPLNDADVEASVVPCFRKT